MAQRTRQKTAGSSLPGSHGLFLVAAQGLPVEEDALIPMTTPKGSGIRLVSLGEVSPVRPALSHRLGILKRIGRAVQAFKA